MIVPPSDAAFPATATISSPEPRLYFGLPSNAGASGPTSTINFPGTSAVPVLISIFPDRDGLNEDHPLTINLTGNNGAQTSKTINVHVIDRDQALPLLFGMTVDFGQDLTGFYSDVMKRNSVRQAAEDWAYFFGQMTLNTVQASAETTFIWNSNGFISGHYIINANPYVGFPSTFMASTK